MTKNSDIDDKQLTLGRRFDGPLGIVARRCVRVWFNQSRLDKVLTNLIFAFPHCELIYAFDADGRQVSSNIRKTTVDRSAYGQDLSKRPIAVSLSVLNNANQPGAFLCEAYVSRTTRRPCVTVMYRVTSGADLLGFIATDFEPGKLLLDPQI